MERGLIDNQIKIRGYRIEIGEIESILMKINAILQCIVVPGLNLNNNPSLNAYMVLKKKSSISARMIREFLSKYLPEYMIPSKYFVVNEFILTANGKINRQILPLFIKDLNTENKYAPPTTTTEKLLKEIWCSVFKMDNISIYSDFFEIGGNSLLSIRIISLINAQFSVTLNIKNLFEFTTIHSLAKEIERVSYKGIQLTSDLNYSCIVPLKTTGKQIPLFLIHPIGGSIFWYQLLAKYLSAEQPLYAIQDPGLDQNEFIFSSIEDMAKHYLEAIKIIQPIGPYILGGASFGSTVAIEIAKQLQENKESVPIIISLDGWAYYPTLQNDTQYFQNIMQEQNRRIMHKYHESNLDNAAFLLKLQSHREHMLIKYQLPRIKSKLILFKAAELNEIFQFNAPFNWWDDYSDPPIELHVIPGNHETIFYEPNVKILAKKLNKSLTKIRELQFITKTDCIEN